MKASLLLAMLALANGGVHPAPQVSGSGWKQGELLSLDESPVSFVISLKESADTVAQIKKIALDVSDPSSKNYGNYLSSDELAAITAPSHETLQTVTTWLEENQITSFVTKGSRVEVTTTHELAQNLFQTRFQTLINSEHNLMVVRAADYALPDAVEAVTAAVFGLHGLPLPSVSPLVHITAGVSPAEVTPAVLTKTYNIGGVTPKSDTKNKQAVAEFQVKRNCGFGAALSTNVPCVDIAAACIIPLISCRHCSCVATVARETGSSRWSAGTIHVEQRSG